jgi:hypothetical protein
MENYMDRIVGSFDAVTRAQQEAGRRMRAAAEAQIALPSLLSGAATFDALAGAVQELRRLAPDDCDVWILVGDIFVREARFIEPHTFAFEGFDEHGDRAWVVQHFSQLSARVVYRTKRDDVPFTSGVIHGFNPNAPSA